MNASTEEGITLVDAVGGFYITWQAPQLCTIRSLAASFLSAESNYQVPRWTQATTMGKKNKHNNGNNKGSEVKKKKKKQKWKHAMWWEEEIRDESMMGGKWWGKWSSGQPYDAESGREMWCSRRWIKRIRKKVSGLEHIANISLSPSESSVLPHNFL